MRFPDTRATERLNGAPGIARFGRAPRRCHAFTLIEMLVVIGIIALMTAMGVPALKNLTKSKGMSVAERELRDVFSYARQLALTSRSTVYVVFNPTNVFALDTNRFKGTLLPSMVNYDKDYHLVNNLVGGQFNTYAIYAKRTVGAQPGTENPYYLQDWNSLPDGVYIPPSEFENASIFQWDSVRYPTASSTNLLNQAATYPNNLNYETVPHIAFNPRGQIDLGQDIWLPLTEGSIIYPREPDKSFTVVNAEKSFLESRLPAKNGEIRDGVRYIVRTEKGAINAQVIYNGFTYNEGDTFVGVAGVPMFTLGGPVAKVFEFEGIHLSWLTGRAEIVRPGLGQQP